MPQCTTGAKQGTHAKTPATQCHPSLRHVRFPTLPIPARHPALASHAPSQASPNHTPKPVRSAEKPVVEPKPGAGAYSSAHAFAMTRPRRRRAARAPGSPLRMFHASSGRPPARRPLGNHCRAVPPASSPSHARAVAAAVFVSLSAARWSSVPSSSVPWFRWTPAARPCVSGRLHHPLRARWTASPEDLLCWLLCIAQDARRSRRTCASHSLWKENWPTANTKKCWSLSMRLRWLRLLG